MVVVVVVVVVVVGVVVVVVPNISALCLVVQVDVPFLSLQWL